MAGVVAASGEARAQEELAERRLDASLLEGPPPAIDGDLTDWPPPTGLDVGMVDQAEQATPATRASWGGVPDASATFRLAVDREWLYLGIAVQDDVPFHPGVPWWHGDAVELFLDVARRPGQPPPSSYRPGCWQLFLMPRSPDLSWGVAFRGQEPRFDDAGLRGVQVAHRERPDGYDMEARLPLAGLGVVGVEACEVGFALALDDADVGPSDPGTYLSWNAQSDLFQRPDRFGVLGLPRRPAGAPLQPPAGEAAAFLLGAAIAIVLALVAVLLLAGPGARALARLGPVPKGVGLVLLAILALVYALDGEQVEARARRRVRGDLERLATEAESVAREAADLGVLPPGDPGLRRQRLSDLLAGRRVAAILPPESVEFSPLAGGEPDLGADGPRYRLPLDTRRVVHFGRDVAATKIRLHLEIEALSRGDEQASERVLGEIEAQGPGGSSVRRPVEVRPVTPGLRVLDVDLGTPGPWARAVWRPAATSPPAVLRGIDAVLPGEPASPLLLSASTVDGIPVLGGPETPIAGRVLPAGAAAEADLPYLLGADRLWLVLSAPAAFPTTLGDEVAARVEVAYDRGNRTEGALRNGQHLVAEVLPTGIDRPPDTRSRVAYAWTDASGVRHTHDLVAIRLDPSRRPTTVRLVNEGRCGPVRWVAATLARTREPPRDSVLGIAPGEEEGTDLVFALRPSPSFAERLGPGDEPRVRVERRVGPADGPTALTLSAPLPPEVAAKQSRTRIALLTCLALGLVFLVFLAADAVERFRRLTFRLAFAVLVAALVPLGATLVLLDRSTTHRLEAEEAARGRGALGEIRSALEESLRRTREAAANLAEHLLSEPPPLDAARAARIVRFHRAGHLAPGTANLALVTGADGLSLTVPSDEPDARLAGPRFLAARAQQEGVHLSPWDGVLLVGTARRGTGERWVRVSLGVQVGDRLLTERARAAVPGVLAAVVLLDSRGNSLASTGEAGLDLAAALARRRDELAPRLPIQSDVVLPEVEGSAGTVLAAVTALPAAGIDGEPAWLAVGLPRADLDRARDDQRADLAWLGLFGVVLVAGVAGLTARRVAEPVKDLVRVTEAVRRGEFDVSVPPAGTDEVGDLTVAFDQMRHDLKHRLGDLDVLTRAHVVMARSLDYPERAARVVDLLKDSFGADAAVVLDVVSAGGPIAVAAERGRRSTFGDRTFRAAAGGWIEAALKDADPVEVVAPAEDPRVRAEGAIGARLVEDRPAFLACPLRTGEDTAGLAVLAYDDPARLPQGTDRRLLGPLAGVCALALHNARLYRLAALDEATRLPGATAFEAALRSDVEHAVSGGAPVTLLRIGLDHVEHVTLRRGVEPARALLRALGDALREVGGDLARLGRLREDEVAVRLRGISREEALARAEPIRARLGRVEVVPEEGGEGVSTGVTVGLARAPEDAQSLEFLLDAAARALAAARREGGDRVEDAARLDRGLVDVPPYEEGAVIRSEKMVQVVEAARRAARTDASVLVTGETGTGKEVIANLIHRRSTRSDRPFVKVNCAAFPETLLESELFGHERGAFTGADRRREGRFELADGGTLFLDEIAEMAPTAQVKLLRVLQERQFTRLGGTRPVDVDVRIIAATNQELEAAVAAEEFREDLYYRLNVIRLEMPPLRERREEIPVFVERFLEDARRRTGRGPQRLTTSAMDLLYRHPWPGNVRELKNVIERCAVMCDAEEAGPEHLRLDGGRPASTGTPRAAPRDELSDRQKTLLDHLARHGRCTNRQYYEMTATSPRTGLRDLQDLMARGLILRDGKRRGAVYRLP